MDESPDRVLPPRSPMEIYNEPYSPFDRPHSKGPLLQTANLASMFSPTEDGGSQKYYYETARVPSDDSSYDFAKHHPRVWSSLCQTQIFRIVYCLVHNVHPYFFSTNMGSFVKFDFVDTIEPPNDMCKLMNMKYLLFLNRRTKNLLVLRIAPAKDLIGVVKLSCKDKWLACSLETLSGRVYAVNRLDATHSWDTMDMEKAFKTELVMKGYLSKYQALRFISSIPHPHGMPQAVWNPRGVYPTRVAKKMKVTPGPNRAFKNFDAVDDEHLAAGWDKLKILQEELVDHDHGSDSYSDSESDEDVRVRRQE